MLYLEPKSQLSGKQTAQVAQFLTTWVVFHSYSSKYFLSTFTSTSLVNILSNNNFTCVLIP